MANPPPRINRQPPINPPAGVGPTYLHKRFHSATYRGSVNTKSKHRRVEVPGRVTRVGWTSGNLLEISSVAGRLPDSTVVGAFFFGAARGFYPLDRLVDEIPHPGQHREGEAHPKDYLHPLVWTHQAQREQEAAQSHC